MHIPIYFINIPQNLNHLCFEQVETLFIALGFETSIFYIISTLNITLNFKLE